MAELKYHWISSHAFELMLKVKRNIASPCRRSRQVIRTRGEPADPLVCPRRSRMRIAAMRFHAGYQCPGEEGLVVRKLRKAQLMQVKLAPWHRALRLAKRSRSGGCSAVFYPRPAHQPSSRTSRAQRRPKAMRYQAKGVKSWLAMCATASARIGRRMQNAVMTPLRTSKIARIEECPDSSRNHKRRPADERRYRGGKTRTRSRRGAKPENHSADDGCTDREVPGIRAKACANPTFQRVLPVMSSTL